MRKRLSKRKGKKRKRYHGKRKRPKATGYCNSRKLEAMKLWRNMSTVRRARWLSRVGIEPSIFIAASDWVHLLPSVKERLIRNKTYKRKKKG